MITPAYSPTATERVLPRLALDFTTASLDPRVTVTRALNTATRFNSSGFIEGVNADLPRFDFDPVTKVCRGLLIEETRNNLCTYSQAISSTANWNANTTVTTTTSGAPLSPDNSSSMVKLVESAVNQNQRISSPFLGQAATTYTWSVFAKAAERSILQLTVGGGISGTSYANFDLANGVIGSYVGNVPIITPVGNGIYRCQMTVTSGSASSDVAYFNIQTSTSAARGAAYAGDGSSGLYVWGAVFEAGAFATSYIPTTTTSLTRNADVVSMTGANFTSWYNAGPGTLLCQASQPIIFASSRSAVSLNSGPSNRATLYRQSAGPINGYMAPPGVAATSSQNAVANTAWKAALALGSTTASFAANSVLASTGYSHTIDFAALNSLNIGNASSSSNEWFCGHIQKILYYTQRLTDAESRAFTK